MGLLGFGLSLAGIGIFLLAGGLAGIFSSPEDFLDVGNSMAIVFSFPFLLVGVVMTLVGALRTMHDPEGESPLSHVREDE